MQDERTAQEQRKLAAIMFTDVVGYSALTQKNEALALELLEEHRKQLRQIFPKYGGSEIKTIGDGFLVEFESALEGVHCAIDIQKSLSRRNSWQPTDRKYQIRIGLHVGDVVHREHDVLGDGVNIASRIERLAGPGGICISEQMFAQVRNKVKEPIVKLGERDLKNIAESVEIYRILLPGQGWRMRLSDRFYFGFRQRKARSLLLILVAATLAAAGLHAWRIAIDETKGPTTRGAMETRIAPLDKYRIAVLPFTSISPFEEEDYFAAGIGEELTSALSKISGLHIIARTSVLQYKGAAKDIGKIGRELKVGTVIDGNVRKLVNRLRISVQLIDVQTQEQLWSQEFDKDLKDIYAIQSEVAQSVADALKVRLMPDEKRKIDRKATENLEAYTSYLKGRYYWNRRTEEGLRQGIDYFNRAIEKDPLYALAYSGLADSYALMGSAIYGALPPEDTIKKAKAAAGKALEIDDSLAEAHASLGYIHWSYDWDWARAEREFKRAIDLDPGYATAHHWYSLYLMSMGRTEDGLQEMRRAQELDPLSLVINTDLGRVLYYARRYDEAIEQYRETLEMDPNFARARHLLGLAYEQKSMFAEGIAELQKALSLSGNRTVIEAAFGHAYAASGNPAEAMRIADELKERLRQRYVPSLSIAMIYVGLADTEQAFEWLGKAYEERSGMAYLKADPIFDSLRTEQRFIDLLKRVGLEK